MNKPKTFLCSLKEEKPYSFTKDIHDLINKRNLYSIQGKNRELEKSKGHSEVDYKIN